MCNSPESPQSFISRLYNGSISSYSLLFHTLPATFLLLILDIRNSATTHKDVFSLHLLMRSCLFLMAVCIVNRIPLSLFYMDILTCSKEIKKRSELLQENTDRITSFTNVLPSKIPLSQPDSTENTELLQIISSTCVNKHVCVMLIVKYNCKCMLNTCLGIL